jgi:hypothetical protein
MCRMSSNYEWVFIGWGTKFDFFFRFFRALMLKMASF